MTKRVIIEPVELSSKNITLVEGEATGHHHQVVDREKLDGIFALPTRDTTLKHYLVLVKKNTELRHFNVKTKKLTLEHNTIQTPVQEQNGLYVFGNQRHTDNDGKIRVVID